MESSQDGRQKVKEDFKGGRDHQASRESKRGPRLTMWVVKGAAPNSNVGGVPQTTEQFSDTSWVSRVQPNSDTTYLETAPDPMV